MSKEFAKGFYNSKRWDKTRRAYIMHRISVDGGLCEICHNRSGFIVHHKTHLNPDNIETPEVSIGMDNLQYVCKACHDAIHDTEYRHREKKQSRTMFDSNGDVCPLFREK